MKSTIAFVCAALVGTTAFAQQSLSQPLSEGSTDRADNPVGEVFFEFNSAAVPSASRQLAAIADWAKHHRHGSIVLDGNTDSTGPAAYNIRLSARRAEAVRDQLIGMGVSSDRIVLALYGEDGLRRTTDALDRRVTIWTTEEPLHAIIDTTLVRGKAVLWTRPVTYAELHPLPATVATR